MSNIKLSSSEAFLAMYTFLENYYMLTKSEDIGCLLGALSLLNDGNCADPALIEDSQVAVQKALSGDVDARIQINYT